MQWDSHVLRGPSDLHALSWLLDVVSCFYSRPANRFCIIQRRFSFCIKFQLLQVCSILQFLGPSVHSMKKVLVIPFLILFLPWPSKSKLYTTIKRINFMEMPAVTHGDPKRWIFRVKLPNSKGRYKSKSHRSRKYRVILPGLTCSSSQFFLQSYYIVNLIIGLIPPAFVKGLWIEI
jgi:hypothetical protein